MRDSSTAPTTILQFRQDIQARLRERVREAIEATLDEELTLAFLQNSGRIELTTGNGLKTRTADCDRRLAETVDCDCRL